MAVIFCTSFVILSDLGDSESSLLLHDVEVLWSGFKERSFLLILSILHESILIVLSNSRAFHFAKGGII